MQPVDDLKLHQFFFRRAKNLVLLEVAHVPMRASHRCCQEIQIPSSWDLWRLLAFTQTHGSKPTNHGWRGSRLCERNVRPS